MAKRYLYLFFPYLLTDWLAIKKPAFKDTSFVFTSPIRGRVTITATSPLASKQGISKGMALADARAVMPDIGTFEDKPGRSENLLKKLALWCIRFAPVVAVDQSEGIILDMSGCAHLWGGEEAYRSNILSKINSLGYHCGGAISSTVGTAWAIARFGKDGFIVPAQKEPEFLFPLPPQALRLDPLTIARLQKLGLTTIGRFIQMPRSALRRRFGADMLLKLGQALGTEKEAITPVIVIPPYQERLPCMEPIRTATGIQIAIETLLESLCKRLSSEGLGVRSAILKCYRLDGKMISAEIGTSRSTAKTAHLLKLFALKIPGIEPKLGIELFTMEAVKTEPVDLFQEKLWNGGAGLQHKGLAELLDRISGKIPGASIRRYLPQAHYWPERSIRPSVSLNEPIEMPWRSGRPRPVQLLPRPETIAVTAPIPDYPPMNFRYKGRLHQVKRADGPERIEREWWIDQGEHRDYYVIEDEKGRRYWLFRSGHYDKEGTEWFIHGFFA